MPKHRVRSYFLLRACCLTLIAFLLLCGTPSLQVDAASEPKTAPQESPSSTVAPTVRIVSNYGRLPLSFEANQGQTDSKVKFVSRGPGYNLFLTGSEAVLSFRTSGNRGKDLGAGIQDSGKRPSLHATNNNGQGTNDTALTMRLLNANVSATAIGAYELPGKANYFIGNDPKKWRTNVPTFAKVNFKDVYPGVDLVYYGNQSGQLEYDFVVAPGANPNSIRFSVSGTEPQDAGKLSSARILKSRIDPADDLVLQTSNGDIRFHKPVAYQLAETRKHGSLTHDAVQRTVVDGHYRLARNDIEFKIASYDHSRPLYIDPVLTYSTYLGGNNIDDGRGIAVDASGNVYVAGTTDSTNFPTMNPFQGSLGSSNGTNDAFVTKINAAGSALVFSTYLGGSSDDQASGIAVDGSGNAYVTDIPNRLISPPRTPISQRTWQQAVRF